MKYFAPEISEVFHLIQFFFSLQILASLEIYYGAGVVLLISLFLTIKTWSMRRINTFVLTCFLYKSALKLNLLFFSQSFVWFKKLVKKNFAFFYVYRISALAYFYLQCSKTLIKLLNGQIVLLLYFSGSNQQFNDCLYFYASLFTSY